MIGYVYSPSTRALKAVLDTVSDYYLEDLFDDAGEIEFYVSLQYASDIQEDDIVWFGGRKASIVEGIALSKNSEGKKMLKVTGRTAESYLERRTIYPSIQKTGNVSTVMRFLLDNNVVNPTDPSRQISFITLDAQQQTLGDSISYQQTGGNLLSEIVSLCQAHSLGFLLEFNPENVSFVFKVYQGTNHSVNQSSNPTVYISSRLDDILDSSYQSNTSNYRNFAYVGGEGEGSERTYATVDPDSVTGYSRRELFVDARDLQSEVDGTTVDANTYTAMLQDRGLKKLESNKIVQEYSADIVQHPSAYTFGVDYNLGDTVTVYDADLQVTVDAVVSALITTKAQGKNSTSILFGYGPPTIHKKLKEVMYIGS